MHGMYVDTVTNISKYLPLSRFIQLTENIATQLNSFPLSALIHLK